MTAFLYLCLLRVHCWSIEPPSTRQTALALRPAIWRKDYPRWHVRGIPAVLHTDHERDFTSQHLEQVSAGLKIRLLFATPGQPRGRGRIERFFGTAQHMRLCDFPGYAPPKGAVRVRFYHGQARAKADRQVPPYIDQIKRL
jgi:transposase InsO family protein